VRTVTALPPLLPPGDLCPEIHRVLSGKAAFINELIRSFSRTRFAYSNKRAHGRTVRTEHIEGTHAKLILRAWFVDEIHSMQKPNPARHTMFVLPTMTAPAALSRDVMVD
jgi:hypothetical protein